MKNLICNRENRPINGGDTNVLGKRFLGLFVAAVFLLAGGTVFTACERGVEKEASAVATKYHCPMHPTYTSDRSGDCPICGMRLVPIKAQESAATPREKTPLFYRNPMDPPGAHRLFREDKWYVPVFAEEGTNALGTNVPSGRSSVQISEEREQLIGVKTSSVARQDISKLVRASGRIAYDPDLYSALVEYREALKSRNKAIDSPWSDVRERTEGLISSSRLRLQQMGLSDSQIDRLGRAKGDPTNLLLGQKGGTVWVYAQIYEYESGLVKAGQKMEISSVAYPGRSFIGQVVAVDTILNPETRTLRVRGEVPSEGMLKPEMYVEVSIPVFLGRRLAAPQEAVMDTGTRKIAFVKIGPGRFEPRVVTVGQEAENVVEVLDGLSEGEEVVTSANFFIDSESKLRAAAGATQ
ncbi:MAG: efflux RND transporter periplasmic adaptor subunit [Elusimicrobia bacterium]|nr:efflux RND transporter periplasmic adaptor subunit [Elusimicrobiota bacterium]